jgi:hypothetical protein
MIPQIVYFLCAVTSFICMGLLLRAYHRSRLPLLFWSGIAFLAFAAANILLFIDLVVFPTQIDLLIWRNLANLAGVVLLLYGLIKTNP